MSNIIQLIAESIVKRRIACAAIKFMAENAKGKLEHIVITGVRHYSPDMSATIDLFNRSGVALQELTQGFLDHRGVFCTREEAWVIANAAGQVIREVGGNHMGRLYSENLY